MLDSKEIRVDRMRGGPNAGPTETTTMDVMAVPNFVLNEARTPANLVGAGLLKKGSQAMDALTGPLSGRGMALSSADNVIPGFYANSGFGYRGLSTKEHRCYP